MFCSISVGNHLFAKCNGTGISGNTYVVINQGVFSGTYNVTNLLAYAPFNSNFTGSGTVSGGGTSGTGLNILVINDNLIIDKNFTFSNTIIEMGDNASLTVLAGVKLKINNSIIRSGGCGILWNTIDATDLGAVPFTGGALCTTCTTCSGQHYKYTGAAVEITNSVIQDAVTAVQLSIYSNSNFSGNRCIITGNTFQKNETSIAIKYVDKVPGHPVSFNYNAFSNINNRCDAVTFSISSNVFQNSPTLPHINTNIINPINTGISLYRTAFTFTGYNFYNNTFQYLQTGINSFASKWVGTNNIFRFIGPSVANPIKDYDGAAIFINDAVPIDAGTNLPYLSQGNYVGWGTIFSNMVSSNVEISVSTFQDCGIPRKKWTKI
jgi:hypothetical protein